MRRYALLILALLVVAYVAAAGDHVVGSTSQVNGTVTSILPIAEATCASGFYVDTDQDGTRDDGENCVNPDSIFYASSYAASSTTAGIDEALTAACAAFPTHPYGGVVVMPQGTVAVTTVSTMSCNWVTLTGHGMGTRITPAAGQTVFACSTVSTSASNYQFRNFTIDWVSANAHANNIGIDCDTTVATSLYLDNVRIVDNNAGNSLGIGIRCDGCITAVFNNVSVLGFSDGLVLTGDVVGNNSYPNNITIIGGKYSSNGDDGIVITNAHADITLIGVATESNGGDGVECNAVAGDDYSVINFVGGYSESNTNSSLHRPSGGCPFSVSGYRFSSTGTAPDFRKVGTGDPDIFRSTQFSDNGIVNASGEPIIIEHPVDLNAVVCADPAVCIVTTAASITSAVASLNDQADGRNLSCDSTLGICPNPRSTLLLDTRIFFAAARGGNRDDDGSMWTGPGTANATSDWINSSTTLPAVAGANGYTTALTTPDDGDSLYCRDNTAFTAGPSGCTTCTATMAPADPLPIVWLDGTTGLYEALGMSTFSGCNSATGNVTTTTTRSTANAGSFQTAMPDGVHPGSYLSALLAQTLLAGTVELFEYPVSAATNMIANGDATSAATNWTEVGSGTVAHDAAEAIPADYNNGNFYNGGISLTGRAANTDALLTPPMTTVPGRWYVAKGYARLNSTGAEDIVVQPWDVSSGAALATYQTYQVKGSHYIALTAGATTQDRQCFGGCYFIVKFLATDTDTAIAISSTSGTGTIHADNWIGMEAPTERLGLTPLFPNNGGIGLHVEGDSRSNDANDFADAIDDAIAAAVPRPDFATIDLVYGDNTNATAGRTADDVVTAEAFSAIRTDTVGGRYTVVFLGVNDVGSGTPASVAADWNAIADRIRQRGGRPIIVLEPPYRGNTNLTSCEGGTENCTTTIDELADLMMHSATGVLHQ